MNGGSRWIGSSALAVLMLVVSCTTAISRWHRERVLWRSELTAALGRDPVDVLAEIGRQAPDRARAFADRYLETLDGQQRLRWLRLGLGHDDEAVVFGAMVMMAGHDRLPLPELRNAARIVVPRLGEADCPVSADDSKPLIGSGDFRALTQVIPRLPAKEAVFFLGELHRMVRPDAVAPLLTVARQTAGEVRNRALSDAAMTVCYSGELVETYARGCLEIEGVPAEPVPDSGLHPVLHAFLWHGVRGGSRGPGLASARWLALSQPDRSDLPLLRQLLTVDFAPLRLAALWSLGSMRDAESLEMLRGAPPEGFLHPKGWQSARLRRSGVRGIEELLRCDDERLLIGLCEASPERWQAYWRELLILPEDELLLRADWLGAWGSGALSFEAPPFEPRVFADLEGVVAETEPLRPVALRAMVRALPCCETSRLADRLLELSDEDLFRPARTRLNLRHIGHAGEWAFLEVTRPTRFAAAVRRGADSAVVEVAKVCAKLLASLAHDPGLRELEAPESGASVERHFYHQGRAALAADDVEYLDRLLQPVRDGRYATHHASLTDVYAHAGLRRLPFWIDQLGSNCCKCVLVEGVLERLFGCTSEAFHRSNYLEPAARFLRRTLLPVAHRLRWSKIANGYVVAGN